MFCSQPAGWVFRLQKNYSWQSPYSFDRDWAFKDWKGRTRLILGTDGVITVTRGYAWDGCTPKLCLFDLTVGTPDGFVHSGTGKPKCYHASLIHDALYQFLPEDPPLNRAQADHCFRLLMGESKFIWRHLYWIAVRALGWLFRPITRRVRQTFDAQKLDCTALGVEEDERAKRPKEDQR